jgi:type III protein arginine methyltransferase
MAARAGATSVVACDLHESLCDVARKAAAANGFTNNKNSSSTSSSPSSSSKISVVTKDVALLQRGHEVRPLGVNIVIADMFDAGLTGDQFPYLLDLTRKKVVQPGATVVPAAATMYCMGIEALTTEVEGVKVSSFNAYRWDGSYVAVKLKEMPHRVLTKPTKISETFFNGEKRPRPRDSLVKLDIIAPGMLNAVVFWFDLHLDDVESITSGKLEQRERGLG